MKKIIIVAGLTATGKSDFAVEIAKKFNGEIISADSVQVYKKLNIGSAKVTKDEMQNIQHHLIDIIEPNENYSVGQFVIDFKNALAEIEQHDKIPIVVGGTGLYIKSLLYGYNFGNVDKNEALREHYRNLAETKGNQFVYDILKEKSPELAEKVHFNNIKRVIRYLELCEENQATANDTYEYILKDYDILTIALMQDRTKLYNRLDGRVDKMIKLGLFDEVKSLLDSGISGSAQSLNSIGYKETVAYLSGELDKEKAIELIKQHTRNYAKRQITFLKTIDKIEYYDIDSELEKAKERIKHFLGNNL